MPRVHNENDRLPIFYYHAIQNFGGIKFCQFTCHKNLVDNILANTFVILHSLFSWLTLDKNWMGNSKTWNGVTE